MKISVLILSILMVGCASKKQSLTQIDLDPDQKLSRITFDDGELKIESRCAYADEEAEKIFYTTYDVNGEPKFRYIVVEHISGQ